MTQPIVRAIDVGYGNTKFVALRQGAGEVHCGIFPSIAPQASVSSDLGGDLFQRRNTANILVNGVRYEVGKDSRLAQDVSYGRTLDPGFASTDAYIALIRGAIYYMGVDVIDVLVVGLPVNTYESNRGELEQRLVGDHLIPSPRTKDGGLPLTESSRLAASAFFLSRSAPSSITHCRVTATRRCTRK